MALSEARLAGLLAYCRIDELSPEEEPVFDGMVQAAVSYMEQAGIDEPEAGTPRRGQYDLCLSALVLDAWDRRGTAGAEKSAADNPSFRRMVNQLKLTAPVSKLDTVNGKMQSLERNILQYAEKLGLTPSGRIRLAQKRAEQAAVKDPDSDLFGD